MTYKAYILSCLLFAILTIVCSIITIICILKEKKDKSTHAFLSTLAALFSAFFSLFSYSNITIPSPIIYPHDTPEGLTSFTVKMESDKGTNLEIYYSLDEYTDPKDGNIYENEFTINVPTTVTARSNFLFWWSDISQKNYNSEKIYFETQAQPPVETSDDIHMQEETVSSESYNENSEQYSNESNNILESSQDSEQANLSQTEIINELQNDTETKPVITEQEKQAQVSTTDSPNITEGLNAAEGYNLMTYINQYRIEAGLSELTWNANLEQEAKNIATNYATGEVTTIYGIFHVIGRQCNGAKNAQTAVSDWINGNSYIPSETEYLLSVNFTQIGGALYYLPNGNEYGYHYFWVICLL